MEKFNLREQYYTFDRPVPYKNLLFYPVKMKDYYHLSFFASSLVLEKTADKNPMIAIPMSYLEYLFYFSTEENRMIYILDAMLRLSLGKMEDDNFYIRYGSDNKKPTITIGEDVYYPNDFDEIRTIITEQNDIELPDETIQKDVRDSMESARRYKAKMSGKKLATLEDQMVALSVYTGWPMESIYEMSVRKFKRAIIRADHILHQKIYLQSEMSGMVSFKDKSVLSGWLADINNRDSYSDVKVDLDSLKGKVDLSEAKK